MQDKLENHNYLASDEAKSNIKLNRINFQKTRDRNLEKESEGKTRKNGE